MPEKRQGNGIRRGAQYLDGLRDGREVWLRGERVPDVTTHPGLYRGAATLAAFMDRQFQSPYSERVTFEQDGRRYAMSFLLPRSREDVLRRGEAFYEWASWSNGMFGRTPDYKNASVTAFAASAEFLSQGRPEFAENMRSYYEFVRDNDKVLTHTLVNPTYSYAQAKDGRYSDQVALQVVDETDAGIVVHGARLLATLGPHADEIEVFPSTLLQASEDNQRFAFAFALPVNAPGIRLICRDSYDHGKATFDAPLASRFEEMDAVVVFDRVLVPWERVFMYRDPALCNKAFAETNAVIHMMHQVVCGKLAKAEFIVGLLCAMARATGKDKDMTVKGQIAEAMWIAETVRAFRYSAEQQAVQDRYGNWMPLRRPLDTSRNLFPKMYPRLIELVQLLGSSSLMATPCEADFGNEIAADVERYFETMNLSSRDRVALFRLAHDVAVSGFGNRQVLYERFFFGPQNVMASVYFDLYDRDAMIGRVEQLLAG
ncbi:MAG: 4-hydroxyphenylacetate 3-monooxygenase, oxygenase component [Gammaproteobacteria bacterium]|nr:4-hydroxyphenylacetate 3-monooxygenase, oxygenase component [Gammaproteobacteria bacterium]MDH4253584.1 4-hydroxyphenylacetate 3-monooxygenase, oxygenase component [Gammaproteobacteria bacterium]MDH5310169.1 4-hydroxyphenylacetate 3-monooxygenase, oxygenase component [Gammaproteobacteria bacterium]